MGKEKHGREARNPLRPSVQSRIGAGKAWQSCAYATATVREP